MNQVLRIDDEVMVRKDVSHILTSLNQMLQEAQSLPMTSEVAYNQVTSMYSKAKEWEKMIDTQRKAANAPYQTVINAHNDKANNLLDPLRGIQAMAKRKASEYQTFLRDKEEQELKEAAAILEVETPIAPEPKKTIRGQGAQTINRTIRKFRIVAPDLVPDKYFVIDEKRIKSDIDLGVATIEGVEIYDEVEVTLRSR